MGIMNYISEQKNKFKNRIETNRSQTFEAKKVKLDELNKENKKLQERAKVNKEYDSAVEQHKSLQKQAYGNNLGQRIAGNIKSKIANTKKSDSNRLAQGMNNSLFTKGASYGNPFSKGTIGTNHFSSTGKEAKPKIKSKKIIKIEY